jgi:hypothetical protein
LNFFTQSSPNLRFHLEEFPNLPTSLSCKVSKKLRFEFEEVEKPSIFYGCTNTSFVFFGAQKAFLPWNDEIFGMRGKMAYFSNFWLWEGWIWLDSC